MNHSNSARLCPQSCCNARFRTVSVLWLAMAFFSLLAFVWSTRAHAETTDVDEDQTNPVKQLTLEQLGNVEVTTPSRQPEKVRDTSAAIYVITEEDIERSGATSIPEALRLAPGVEVARIDSNKWSIGIRGFGSRLSRDVLVLIDGRTVYSTLLAGTYWEVQNVMLKDVERIEVIRGPGATIWGPNALNGVINIITKDSKDTRGSLVDVGGGNVDQGFFNTRYGAGNGSTFDYRIYAMGFDRGPEYHTDSDNYDSWRAAQGGFRMDFAKSARDSFTVEGDIYDEGAGETVGATSYAPPYSQTVQGTEMLSGGNLLGRWQRTQGEGKDFELQVYYDRANRREPNFEDLRNTSDIDFLDHFRLPWREQISWGLEARWSEGADPAIVSGLHFIPEKRTDQLYTGFFQDEIGLVKNRLSLSLGTKVLKTNYTGVQLQPSARLLWTPNRKQSVWAAFTHALRTPSDAERAFYLLGLVGIEPGGIPFFARFNPNPNFKSEEMNGYEAGFRQLVGQKLYFDLTAFFNHYNDLFSEDITGEPYVETNPPPPHLLLPADFGNGLFGTTRGVEIAPEWRPTHFWRLSASYSFLQMEIAKRPNSLDIEPPQDVEGESPRHEITAQSGFDLTKVLSLDLTYRYVSALPAISIQSYSTADARFAWSVRPYLKLSVVGRDLLQPYHYEYASDPGPNVAIKRSAYGEITWQR